MKKISTLLIQYLKDEFDWRLYLGISILLGSGIILRYQYDLNIYFTDDPYQVLKGGIFYGIPYFGCLILISFTKSKVEFWRNTSFWLLSTCILFVLVANQYLLLYKPLVEMLAKPIQLLASKIGFNLFSASVYAVIPAAYYLLSKQRGVWYGFTLKGFDYRSYGFMLALMMPLLFWASFRADFLSMYPRYLPGAAEHYLELSPVFTVLGYESSYIFQFIFLELFFRGFMVMGLEKHLDASAVLPMVCVYAFIHFGKPMPETLGSIFGGFILGVLALRTRTIFGGICIHIGIALFMELFAFLQL